MTRVAWVSAHLLANSGYGKQSREICLRLADLGYEIYAIGGFGSQTMYGMHTTLLSPMGGIVRCLNTWSDPAGSTVFERYHRMFRFDVVVSLWDYQLTEYLNRVDIPWVAQGPVDAPLTKRWASYVRNAARIVAYSKYAYEQMLRFYPPSKVRYIPHGLDTKNVWYPRPEAREEVRRRLGVPEDAFLFVNVSDNVPRKQLGFLLWCFREFLKRHPEEDIYLLLWTNWSVGYPRGLEIRTIIDELEISDYVKLPALDPMINPIEDAEMAAIYSACDVMLHTSLAEGFGLPLLEAAACGVPAIATRSTAMIELVEPVSGWLIDVIEDYVYFPAYVATCQWHHPPSIKSCLERMEQALEAWKGGRLENLRKKARSFAENYDWERIMPLWDSLLKEVVEEAEILRLR